MDISLLIDLSNHSQIIKTVKLLIRETTLALETKNLETLGLLAGTKSLRKVKRPRRPPSP